MDWTAVLVTAITAVPATIAAYAAVRTRRSNGKDHAGTRRRLATVEEHVGAIKEQLEVMEARQLSILSLLADHFHGELFRGGQSRK